MIIESGNCSCDGVNFHENGKIPGTVSFLQFEYCSSEIKIMISHKVILILTLLQDILSHLTIQNSITGLRSSLECHPILLDASQVLEEGGYQECLAEQVQLYHGSRELHLKQIHVRQTNLQNLNLCPLLSQENLHLGCHPPH